MHTRSRWGPLCTPVRVGDHFAHLPLTSLPRTTLRPTSYSKTPPKCANPAQTLHTPPRWGPLCTVKRHPSVQSGPEVGCGGRVRGRGCGGRVRGRGCGGAGERQAQAERPRQQGSQAAANTRYPECRGQTRTNPETQLGANRMVDAHTRQQSRELLLVATLVTSLTKQLAVLLLGHTLAALLDYRTHSVSSVQLIAQRTLRPREGTSVHSTCLRIA